MQMKKSATRREVDRRAKMIEFTLRNNNGKNCKPTDCRFDDCNLQTKKI